METSGQILGIYFTAVQQLGIPNILLEKPPAARGSDNQLDEARENLLKRGDELEPGIQDKGQFVTLALRGSDPLCF